MNEFDKIDAQCGVSRMAQVSPEEMENNFEFEKSIEPVKSWREAQMVNMVDLAAKLAGF